MVALLQITFYAVRTHGYRFMTLETKSSKSKKDEAEETVYSITSKALLVDCCMTHWRGVYQIYAASVMFGYFLRRVDSRFQLAKDFGMLPDDNDQATQTLEKLFHEVFILA